MSFYKDRYRMKMSIFACVLCILGAVLFFAAAVFSRNSAGTNSSTGFIFLGFALFGLIVAGGCVFLAIDNSRKIVISQEGIAVSATTKALLWCNCGSIGVFGYYYGMKGTLFFSPIRSVLYTQDSCRKFYNKHHKTAISIAYTPEVFVAVEKFAPPHLVSNLKMLLQLHTGDG